MKEPFSSQMIARVVTGSNSKAVRQFRFDKLSTYGILSDWTLDEVKTLLNELKHAGAIEEKFQTREIKGRERTYQVFALTGLGWEVMKQQSTDFKMVFAGNRRLTRRRPAKRSANDRAHPELLNALKDLRRQLADRDDVPLYVVATNKTLEAIAANQPTSQQAMMSITGIGKARMARYGRALIETVRNWNGS